LEIFKHVFKP